MRDRDYLLSLLDYNAWSNEAYFRQIGELPAEEVEAALETLKEKALLESGDTVVVISSHLAVEEIANSVQMHRVS